MAKQTCRIFQAVFYIGVANFGDEPQKLFEIIISR